MGQEDLRRMLAETYPRLATQLLRPLLELMVAGRKACEGDLDKLLVLVSVALRTTAHRDFKDKTVDELSSEELLVLPGFGTNVQSIAAGLEIPKETIRRKVLELIEAGWLVREERRLYMTGRCYRELASVREHLERMALEYGALVAGLEAAQERPEA